jgi:hypothetical protein
MVLPLNGMNYFALIFITILMLTIISSCSSPVSTIMYSSEVLSPKQAELELGSDLITTSTRAEVSRLNSPLAYLPQNSVTSQRLKTPAGIIAPSLGVRFGMPFKTEGAMRYHFWRGLTAYCRKNIYSIKSDPIGLSLGFHFNYFNWNMFFYDRANSTKFEIREFTVPINLTLPIDERNQLYFAYIPGKRYYRNYFFTEHPIFFFTEGRFQTVSFFNHSLAIGIVDKSFIIEFNVTVYPYWCFQSGIIFPILRRNFANKR